MIKASGSMPLPPMAQKKMEGLFFMPQMYGARPQRARKYEKNGPQRAPFYFEQKVNK
jgi:hypothetical protein